MSARQPLDNPEISKQPLNEPESAKRPLDDLDPDYEDFTEQQQKKQKIFQEDGEP